MTTPAPVCTWEMPCNLGTCSRCFRRLSFQAAKGRRLRGELRAVPLSILRDQLHPPPLDPIQLQTAGDFLLTHGYVRPALDAIGRGQQVVFQVELLSGEHAGCSFVLILPALDHRVQLVDLLRRTGGPIGPCALIPRYLEPDMGTWSICSREPDGSLWDPFGMLEDYPPAPGSDPVPFW